MKPKGMAKRLLASLHTETTGQVLVLFVLIVTLLFGMVGFIVDVGYAWAQRRQASTAVDAAALAGTLVLRDGGTAAEAQDEAASYAARNGFSSALVSIPPSSGSKSGDDGCVEVITSRTWEPFFVTLFNVNQMTARARAVGCVDSTPTPYGIIVLNRAVCSALNLTGNVSITITGAGIFDNSSCPANAFSATGNVTVNTTRNDVVGGWQLTGNVSITPALTHAPPLTDPLADLPYPTPPSGPTRSCPNLNGNGSYTFQPGVYNCTISPNGNWTLTFLPGDYLITGGIRFNGNLRATFNSGTYTLRGLGLVVNGNSQVTANGVTFFIDGGAATLNGNTALSLSAPTSGTYARILIFQRRDLASPLTVNGNAATGNWGTIYAAGAQIRYSGNASTSYQFIADTFLMNGNASVNITYNNGVPAQFPIVRLVE